MKKFLLYILILIAAVGLFGFSPVAHAADPVGDCVLNDAMGDPLPPVKKTKAECDAAGGFWSATTPTNTTTYNFLAPLPCTGDAASGCNGGELTTFDPTQNKNLSPYLNLLIKIFIGICAVLAVIMIVVGGLEYMTSELVSHKEEGKKRITQAIFGLVLALGAWTLLYQINPDLLNADLSSLTDVTVTVNEPENGIQGSSTNTDDGAVVTACKTSELTTITVFGKSVTVNKAVVADLQNVNIAWQSMGGDSFYKVNSIAGYNCREVTNKPGYWSAHAFGIAVDINPGTNPYGSVLKTDMPPAFVNLFKNVGWGWGGGWVKIKDAMHFSSDSS